MKVDPASSLPLYAQVEDILAAGIKAGEWKPGSRLPPEGELIARFSVSRTTIRLTIQNLARRGLIEIRRGKGTFVVQPKIVQELAGLTSFVEDMQALGRKATARLVSRSVVPADETAAAQLAVLEGTPIMKIERVRLADGEPVSFDETYLPQGIGAKVVTNDLEVEPIFSLLENKYDMALIEADYKLEAVSADDAVAQALGIPLGSPIFLIERTSYCADRQPVDFERLYYRGDQICFVTRLMRRTDTRADRPGTAVS